MLACTTQTQYDNYKIQTRQRIPTYIKKVTLSPQAYRIGRPALSIPWTSTSLSANDIALRVGVGLPRPLGCIHPVKKLGIYTRRSNNY